MADCLGATEQELNRQAKACWTPQKADCPAEVPPLHLIGIQNMVN